MIRHWIKLTAKRFLIMLFLVVLSFSFGSFQNAIAMGNLDVHMWGDTTAGGDHDVDDKTARPPSELKVVSSFERGGASVISKTEWFTQSGLMRVALDGRSDTMALESSSWEGGYDSGGVAESAGARLWIFSIQPDLTYGLKVSESSADSTYGYSATAEISLTVSDTTANTRIFWGRIRSNGVIQGDFPPQNFSVGGNSGYESYVSLINDLYITIPGGHGYNYTVYGLGVANPDGISYGTLKLSAPPPPTLTITTNAGGTTSPSPGRYVHSSGESVPVTAYPYPGYRLGSWYLDSLYYGAASTVSVTVSTSQLLYAHFVYDARIEAYCIDEDAYVNVDIWMDGLPTGFTTPHTFTGLAAGNIHTFSVLGTDYHDGLHPFYKWSTGSAYVTITVGSSGIYTAYYSAIVGGVVAPVDKLGLLTPYIGLASAIIVATVASAIYVKRRKERQ